MINFNDWLGLHHCTLLNPNLLVPLQWVRCGCGWRKCMEMPPGCRCICHWFYNYMITCIYSTICSSLGSTCRSCPFCQCRLRDGSSHGRMKSSPAHWLCYLSLRSLHLRKDIDDPSQPPAADGHWLLVSMMSSYDPRKPIAQ